MMRRSIVVLAAAVVLVAGCGGDDGGSKASTLALTLTESSIELSPGEIDAGVVEVAVTDQTEAAGGEVNFTRVQAGSDPARLAADLVANVFTGGPFPDYFLDNAGVRGSGRVTLDQGEYIVWIDLASDLERESTAEDILTRPLTVAEGDNDASLPDANGTITARDYAFETDVSPGPAATMITCVDAWQRSTRTVSSWLLISK